MVFGPVKLSKAIISPYKLLISPFNDADNEVSLSDSHNYEHALGGNDLVHGNGGDDILFGDQGYDVLYGEDGNDNLYGGTENDWLSGGSGNNFIDGGAGTGDSVAYTWYGNTEGRVYVNLAECWAADASSLSVGLPTRHNGATFNDTFGLATDGSGLDAAIENVYGATHSSNYIIGNERDNVVLVGRKDDVVLTNGGNDYIQGDMGNDALFAGAGNDVIYAGPGDDVLAGGLGNDYFSGSSGADYFSSGGGADAFVFGKGDSPYTTPTGANGPVPSKGVDFIASYGADDDIYLYEVAHQETYFYANNGALIDITYNDGSKGSIAINYESGLWNIRDTIHLL